MSERKQDKHASTAGQPRGLGSKNPKQGEEMIGAQAVVASLEAEGVDLVFGYPGGQAIKIYDALYDSKQLHHVLARHEQGAVHEADGYARATGNVGVVIVTSGPGATNTVTGIATAYMDSVPLVVITGQVPRGVIGTDSFQESDIVGITMPVVKHSFLLQSTDELTTTFREAFHIAASGRPGPVLIDIPSDILSEKMIFDYPDKVNLPSYRPTAAMPSRFARRCSACSAPSAPCSTSAAAWVAPVPPMSWSSWPTRCSCPWSPRLWERGRSLLPTRSTSAPWACTARSTPTSQ